MTAKFRFSVVLLLFVLAGFASAQSLTVRGLALRSGELPEVYLRGAKGFNQLAFSATQPGEIIKALAANPFPLYRKEVNEEGEEEFVLARKVKIPTGAKGILLLGWQSGKELNYVAVKDHFASARFKDWLLINTGTKPVAFQVGDDAKPVVVKAGSSTKHVIKAEEGKGAAILARAPFGKKTKTFFSTYWPVHAGKRTIVLFVADGDKIRVKRISDKLVKPVPVP